MKSITARFTALVVVAILLSVAVVGGIAMVTLRDKADVDAAKEMNLTCVSEAQRINQTFLGIEQSVSLEAAIVRDGIDSVDRFFDDEAYRASFTEQVEGLFRDVAEETEGAVTFYFRYNADDIASTQGFLYTRDGVGGAFEKAPLTDMSLYSQYDDEHVGWYYIPVRNGAPTWLVPYQNKNLNIHMISYVIPVFDDDRLLGVIGMDVDFAVIVDQIKEVRAHEGSGYAVLVGEDGTVYYHPRIEYGARLDGTDPSLPDVEALLDGSGSSGELILYAHEGRSKELAYQPLVNGMDLVLVADVSDIEAERNQLISNLAVAALVIVVVFVAIALASGRLLMRPLRELTNAAGEVAKGNLDVALPRAGSSEVSTLIRAYNTTVDRMRDQMAIIDEMAHVDSLTGLSNKASYDEEAAALDERLQAGEQPRLAMVMIDVNDLKRINDSFGHERGDAYLVNSAKLIAGAFAGGKAYRVGGDEFVVVVKDDALPGLEGGLTALEEDLRRLDEQWEASDKRTPWDYPSLAYGAAVFDVKSDRSTADLFKRRRGHVRQEAGDEEGLTGAPRQNPPSRVGKKFLTCFIVPL